MLLWIGLFFALLRIVVSINRSKRKKRNEEERREIYSRGYGHYQETEQAERLETTSEAGQDEADNSYFIQTLEKIKREKGE